MTKSERIKYEALLRIRDFGAAHRALFPESTVAHEAFAQVAEAAARIDAHAKAKPVAARDGRTAKAVAKKAVRVAMRTIATTARGLAVSERGGRDVLRPSRKKAETELLRDARRFVDQSGPVKDALVRLGLPPTFIADLSAAADRLETAMNGRRSGRRDVALAQEGITTAIALGLQAVHQLDIVVPNVLVNQPELLAGWQRDRRLVLGLRKNEVQAVEPLPIAS